MGSRPVNATKLGAMRRLGLLVLAVALLAACGGDDSTEAAKKTTTTTSTTAAPTVDIQQFCKWHATVHAMGQSVEPGNSKALHDMAASPDYQAAVSTMLHVAPPEV